MDSLKQQLQKLEAQLRKATAGESRPVHEQAGIHEGEVAKTHVVERNAELALANTLLQVSVGAKRNSLVNHQN